MPEYKLGAMEAKFAQLMWDNEPISSGNLVKLCEKELGWKKSTTYTMLRRLCERGIFANENGTVRSCMSKEELGTLQSEKIINENFGGSLPQFLAAFTSRNRLSQKDIQELADLIATQTKEGE